MRKIIGSLLCAILILSMPIVSFAQEDTSYTLPDVGMEIWIPSGFTVFTRDANLDASAPTGYEFAEGYMREHMEKNYIYLDALSDSGTTEIIVTMLDSPLKDYSSFPDDLLDIVASAIPAFGEANGIIYGDHEIYPHEQTRFIKLDLEQDMLGSTAYGLQYSTIYGYKAVNVTMYSYARVLSSAEKFMLRKAIDSIHFIDTPPEPASKAEEPSTSEYIDTETGVSFLLPQSWEQVPLSVESEYVKARFVSTKDADLQIMYASTDIWETLSDAEKSGLTRADINHKWFPKSALAIVSDIPITSIETADYNGYEYYTFPTTITDRSLGVPIERPTYNAFRISDGYMYTFQFAGDAENPYFSDFESILGAVKYPGEADNNSAPAKPTSTPNPAPSYPA